MREKTRYLDLTHSGSRDTKTILVLNYLATERWQILGATEKFVRYEITCNALEFKGIKKLLKDYLYEEKSR